MLKWVVFLQLKGVEENRILLVVLYIFLIVFRGLFKVMCFKIFIYIIKL